MLIELIESGVGGKTYNIKKSLYTNNKCVIKMGSGVRQGCSLSPTLFNINITQLARTLEQSA